MLDGLKRTVGATAIKSLLNSLAHSKDTQTTIVGVLAGAVLVIPGLDFSKLLAGDIEQICRLAAGLIVCVIGYYATKPGKDGATSLLGVLAAALHLTPGNVQSFVTSFLIAAVGYFVNKPAAKR